MDDWRNHLQQAIAICGGSQRKLAASVGLSQQAVWKATRRGVSAELASRIEMVTEGRVTVRQLRPTSWVPTSPTPAPVETAPG